MILRIRTNTGIWRVDLSSSSSSSSSHHVSDIFHIIAQTRPHVVYETPLCFDANCKLPLDSTKPLSEQSPNILHNGSMIYCRVDASTCAENTVAVGGNNNNNNKNESQHDDMVARTDGGVTTTKRIIDKDGSIKLVHVEGGGGNNGGGPSSSTSRGFRKGLLPLRDMKMAWTLQEFTDLDNRYNFKIQRQESSFVGKDGLHLESSAVNDFQNYMRQAFRFQQSRFGYLYGRFVDEEDGDDDNEKEEKAATSKDKEGEKNEASNSSSSSSNSRSTGNSRHGWGARFPKTEIKKVKRNSKVIVEAIYEPPQQSDPDAAEGYIILDDPNEDNVKELANMLGLQKVGWIIGHPPREKGFQLSSAEIIMAAELQLECAGGVQPTPFVTVRVTVGDDSGTVVVEAFQVSLQCMEMVAEEALEIGPNPGFCYVNETFTAIQEGKASVTVENNFFLTLVPIHAYQTETFVSMFPRANRIEGGKDQRIQSREEMKRQLSKSGNSGWTLVDLVADFALLLYLCQFLDVKTDMAKICASVRDRENIPLDDGYKLILTSIAGMDSSY